jgi:hypothetical protein
MERQHRTRTRRNSARPRGGKSNITASTGNKINDTASSWFHQINEMFGTVLSLDEVRPRQQLPTLPPEHGSCT